MNFGEAIEELKKGNLVARSGWNGTGMFIAKQIPAVIPTDIIPEMKDVILSRNQSIPYTNQMLSVNKDGSSDRLGWVPSSSDCFAEDWYVVK